MKNNLNKSKKIEIGFFFHVIFGIAVVRNKQPECLGQHADCFSAYMSACLCLQSHHRAEYKYPGQQQMDKENPTVQTLP